MRAGFYRNRSFLSMPFPSFLQTKSPANSTRRHQALQTWVVFIPTNSGFFQSSVSKGQLPTCCLGIIILEETGLFVKGGIWTFSVLIFRLFTFQGAVQLHKRLLQASQKLSQGLFSLYFPFLKPIYAIFKNYPLFPRFSFLQKSNNIYLYYL